MAKIVVFLLSLPVALLILLPWGASLLRQEWHLSPIFAWGIPIAVLFFVYKAAFGGKH